MFVQYDYRKYNISRKKRKKYHLSKYTVAALILKLPVQIKGRSPDFDFEKADGAFILGF